MSRVPRIRFKGFEEDWEQRKLGEICQITMGQSPDGSTYSQIPSDYILVQGNADLKDGWVYPRIWTTQKTKMAEAGDLIMSVRAPAGTMGKTYYDVVIGRGVAGIKGSEFIYQALVKMDSNGYWKILASGSTFESINSDVVNGAELMVTENIDEQNKIGYYLASIDHLITLHQRKLEKLKIIKKLMLENLFPQNGEKTPKIRFSGFTEDWEQRKLGEFGKATGGISIESEFDEHGKYKVISIGSYSEESKYTDQGIRVYKTKKTESRILNKNDLVMILNDKTSSGNIIGRVLLVDKDNTYVYNQRTERIEINKSKFLPEYLYQLLNSDNIREKIICASQGNTQIYVNWTVIREFTYKITTDIEEQGKIARFFISLNHLITLHQSKLDKLQKIKKSMLENMFV